MDVRHPDIEHFVKMKHDLTKVTGANVSIKISDDFMEAVQSNASFTLQFPVGVPNPTIRKEIDARQLWNVIVESATKTAEPGLLMWGNIEKYLPAECYADVGFKTICTNPCAEIPLSAYDSCRLISINLKNFVNDPFTDKATFDFQKFSNFVGVGMRLSDDLVTLEIEKLEKIIEACDTPDEVELWKKLKLAAENGRRTGLGTHGLADALAKLQLPYDSDKGIEMVDKIYTCLRDNAYSESVILARERGAFPVYSSAKEEGHAFIEQLPSDIRQMMKEYGRRNISILTNAPTGSVSIMSRSSSGLEPVFRNSYIRRRKLETSEYSENDFVDSLGDHWKEFPVYHHNVQEWRDLNPNHTGDLPSFFVESDQIDWLKRIKIQSVIQKKIDHAISSTINLPKGTSVDVVSELYLEAWRQGLKGVTIYVDGSRTGVLVTNDSAETKKKEKFPQHSAPKRPELLECDIHHTAINGEPWTVLVGLMDGKPYEVMAGQASLIEIPKNFDKGILTKKNFKKKNNRYDLTFGTGSDTILIKDVVKAFDNPTDAAFTRMISLGLRHGAEVRFMVEQLQKDKGSDMFSFSKCVARILKSYIKDGEVPSDKACPECGSESLVYQDGCATCSSCGHAKCG